MEYNQVTNLLSKAKNSGITIFEKEGKLKIKTARNKVIDPIIIQEIKDNKLHIIDFLKDGHTDGKGIDATEEKTIAVLRHTYDKIPLSFSQEQLWLIDQLEGSVHYHLPSAIHLKSALDKNILENALSDLVQRHEILRTVIHSDETERYQVVRPIEDWKMEYSEGQQFKERSYLNDYVETIFNRPFDLAKDYMFRAHLIKCDEQDHVLVLVVHHIASDGWSQSILVEDLMELYTARVEGRPTNLVPLTIQFADFAIWQRNELAGAKLSDKLDWWEKQLTGVEPLEIPTDFTRPSIQSTKGANYLFHIDQKSTNQLKALSIQEGTTFFMTILTIYKILLYRYARQEDICVGIPLANRDRKEMESIVGYFINTLAMRNDLSGNPTFLEMLHRVKATTIDAYANQEVPFEQIVGRVAKERSLSRNPIFQASFTWNNTPYEPSLALGDLSLDNLAVENSTTYFDLSFSAVEGGYGVMIDILYCSDLFSKTSIERMGQHFNALVNSILAHPNQKIDALELLAVGEKKQLLIDFNNTAISYPKHKNLVAIFEEQVERQPEATALIFDGKTMSYQQLQDQSNQLAHCLLDKDVQPEDKIGILAARGFEMIVSVLGVLKTGAVYVPLNVDYPTSRLQYILEDAAAKIVVYTNENLLEQSGLSNANFISSKASVNYPTTAIDNNISLDAPAYVMYTSGTTGEPKGILVNQQNILKLVYESKYIKVNPDDRVMQWSNFAFDGSTYEIFNTLLSGACLVLITEADAPDSSRLAKVIQENQLSVIFITTALFNAFVDSNLDAFSQLRKILFGGEMVSFYHVKKALEAIGPDKIIHMYGPTETTTYATFYPVRECKNDLVPIGEPLSNTSVYIVNSSGKLAGIGIVGEIWIGGDGVALGYLNKAELNREKFILDPFTKNKGAKLYKTGDLARWSAEGNIEFVGRKDKQVKIRGYRIELGEIEAVLQNASLVRQAVVLAQSDPSGTKRLIAYIVPENTFDKAKIKNEIKSELPDYMIPSLMMEIETLPLNPNGKIDKKALPKYDFSNNANSSTETVKTTEGVEQQVTLIWQELLVLDQIAPDEDFFDLGGHSLIASRVVAAVRKELVVEIEMIDVFKHPTIAELSAFIQTKLKPSGQSTTATITAIWQDLLALDKIGADEDFFDLGGHSLIASRVVAAIRKDLAVEIEMIEVFKNPTIAELSAFVQTKLGALESPIQQTVTTIWQDLLALDKIAVDEDFFDLGGHSLIASRVVAALRKELAIEIEMIEVFKNPTIAELTTFIESKTQKNTVASFTLSKRPEKLPLSYAQERLWFIDQLEGSLHYHIPQILRLDGRLNVAALRYAFATLVKRHEVLRTVYVAEQGLANQVILDGEAWEMIFLDWENFETNLSWNAWINREINRPFDLANDYMLRVHLIRKNKEEYTLLILVHHIASDGWSMPIMMNELVEIYDAAIANRTDNLLPLPIQYADYAVWQRNNLSPELLETQLDYWEEKLKDVAVLQLPIDFPRASIRSTKGALVKNRISSNVQKELLTLANKESATLFMILLAAFKLLLHRYTGQNDICVGTPVANRSHSEVEPLIGYFINTLALRTSVEQDLTFRELLLEVKNTSLAAFSRQEVPLEQIIDRVGVERDPSRSPLFETLFVLQNTPNNRITEDIANDSLVNLLISPEEGEADTSKFDLALTVTEMPNGLSLDLVYASDLFRKETMTNLMNHYQDLLTQVSKHYNDPIAKIQLFDANQTQAFIQKNNQTQVNYDRPATLLEQFESQVKKVPDSIAVEMEEKQLTYQQLEARANQWAHVLLHQGIEPGDYVGILLERSLDMLIAILAIYKSGAAYLPIDPRYPATRVEYMLEDAKVKKVLTHNKHLPLFNDNTKDKIINLNTQVGLASKQSVQRPQTILSPKDCAYVIYTSGSTGKPKGVIMSHESVVNQGNWAQDFFGLTAEDVVMQKTTFCFDPSVWEFFWPLSVGGKVSFAQSGMEGDSQYLLEAIEQYGITTICFIPPMLSVFLQDIEAGRCPSLKRIICGGEALQKSQLERCKEKLPQVQLYNIYGPTEAAIHVTCFKIPENVDAYSSIPLGKPLSNVQILMLDQQGNLVPEGVVGELCIGGVQLAEGYLNRPELTHEKFIKHPFSPDQNTRLYRTGDLARWLPDGNIEYIGRLDNQLKINGFRVELGEVEYLLNQAPGIESAVVLAKKDQLGSNRLIAYVVAENTFKRNELEIYLHQTAPAYMIPSFWIPLPALPLSATGKIDRNALPEPDIASLIAQAYKAPRTETESKLTQIWQELLDLEQVGIQDNFFEIGGHSLLATRVVSFIREAFERKIKVGDIFSYPTIENLAHYLDQLEDDFVLPTIAVGQRPQRIPLTYAQERIWFVDQLGGSTQFHMPSALRLRNDLDKTILEGALMDLIHRNEVLRTSIKSENGEPYQDIMPAAAWQMSYSEEVEFKDDEFLGLFIADEINRPFNLEEDYMLRAHLVKCGPNNHVLVLVIHHIASDGWSQSLLVQDLVEFYSARLNNRAPNLIPLAIQYADYAVWQRKYIAGDFLETQLDWWATQLRGIKPLAIPTDYPRPAKLSNKGAALGFNLEKEVIDQLKAIAKTEDTTLFMTLLAICNILLYRYSGQSDFCIGTSLANRNEKSLEPLVGLFINSLVLRADLSGDPNFRTLLSSVRSTTLNAFAHQDVPFEKIVDRVLSGRDLSRNPIFQVLFTLQNIPEEPELELGELQLSSEDRALTSALYDLAFYLTDTPNGLQIGLVYNTDLFNESTIERMTQHFQTLAKAIVADPDLSINHLQMLTEAEQQQLIDDLN